MSKLLFEFDCSEYEGFPNIVKVYDNFTYTTGGRGVDIVDWKIEDGVWYWRRGGIWESCDQHDSFTKPFLAGLNKILEEILINGEINE